MVLKNVGIGEFPVAQWSGLCAFIAGAHIQSLWGNLDAASCMVQKKSINSCILQDPYSQKRNSL